VSQAIAKEVLKFAGQPVLLNELRGKFGFSEDGIYMREEYSSADMGGKRNSEIFTGATATLRGLCITRDGRMRLGSGGEGGAYFVFKKLEDGQMDAWIEEQKLPISGGTLPFMSAEEREVAYPYEKRPQ